MQARGGKRSYGGFAARAGALHKDFDLLHAIILGHARGILGRQTRRIRRALRDPRNPAAPALAQATVLPCGSVIVTMVLLNVAKICATPRGTIFFAFLRACDCLLRPILSPRIQLTGKTCADYTHGLRRVDIQLLAALTSPTPGYSLLRAFARTRVGLRPLAMHREMATMAQTAIASNLP